jgi:CRP-like cAMP-binding protein
MAPPSRPSAFLENAPRNATVVAATDMELVVVGEREFAGCLTRFPGSLAK